jgi:hypothetical protein
MTKQTPTSFEVDPRIGTLDVRDWHARPHCEYNPTGERTRAWEIVAGDYTAEGEPDVRIEIVDAEHPKDVAEFIVQAVRNEHARVTAATGPSGG